MKTNLSVVASAAAFALALAPSAFAQDYCVPSCSGAGTPKPTLEDALASAGATAGLDRVLVAAGTYTAPTDGGFTAYSNPVEIIGAGAGSTTLTGPTNTSTVLTLPVAGSRVADLHINIPIDSANGTKTALAGNGFDADGIEITAAPGITSPTLGVSLAASSILQRSKISLPRENVYSVGANLGANSAVRDSSVDAVRGLALFEAGGHAVRNRIRAASTGVAVMNDATSVGIIDSLVEMADGGTGVWVNTMAGIDADALVRNCTLVGSGNGSAGISVQSSGGHSAHATVDSTVIRGFNSALLRSVSASEANVDVAYSDFDPTAIIEPVGAGSVTFGVGNINADPLFESPSDLHLTVGSPAIDAGNPADLGNARDVAGDPRLVDGDKDGDARRDIGAFEWQQPVVVASTGGGDSEPTPPAGSAGTGDPGAESASPIATATSVDRTPPIIGELRIDRRRRLSFSVSEQSVVHVVIKKRRSSGRMRPVASLERPFMPGVRRFAIGRVRGKALPRGSYTATVIASDAAQNRSRVQIVRFRVG